jgi:hypothetical protein
MPRKSELLACQDGMLLAQGSTSGSAVNGLIRNYSQGCGDCAVGRDADLLHPDGQPGKSAGSHMAGLGKMD